MLVITSMHIPSHQLGLAPKLMHLIKSQLYLAVKSSEVGIGLEKEPKFQIFLKIVDICLSRSISSKYHKAAVHTEFPGGRKLSQRLTNKIEKKNFVRQSKHSISLLLPLLCVSEKEGLGRRLEKIRRWD